jgi:L-alanine-DL-glutamate epimerase-like enolase superfamily enzyme
MANLFVGIKHPKLAKVGTSKKMMRVGHLANSLTIFWQVGTNFPKSDCSRIRLGKNWQTNHI